MAKGGSTTLFRKSGAGFHLHVIRVKVIQPYPEGKTLLAQGLPDILQQLSSEIRDGEKDPRTGGAESRLGPAFAAMADMTTAGVG